MRPRREGHFRRHRMFWRVYLQSLAVIVVVALFLMVLGWVFNRGAPWDRMPRAVAAQLQAVSPAQRADRLAELGDLTYLDLLLYQRDGTLVAEARQASACPLAEIGADDVVDDLRPDRTVRVGHGYRATPVGDDAYLVARWRGHDPRKFVYAVGGLLLILALVSWPLARRIARPIEAMVGTVDQVGEGDLEARVGAIRKAPGELRRLGAAIDGMLDNLARLRSHEKALLADISHELRTPMARIRVALEWAAEDGDLPEPLKGVDGDLAELEGLVEDVLASARLDPVLGESMLHRDLMPAQSLLDSAAQRFARRHPTLALDAPTDLDATLNVDPRFAHRVLDNLLDNAGRYGAGPVQISVVPADGHLAFTVRDHGPGVPQAELPHLFDAFWRAERSRDKARGGVGLGTTLCQRIVLAHGGTIQASLPEGGGLAVRFTLPLG